MPYLPLTNSGVKKLLLFLFLSICCRHTIAQDSCSIRISLLTCAPGEELYTIFGHTALRVQDGTGTDLVYNYGSFEFGPDFYMQFIRGKLLYFLSVDEYPYFQYQYEIEGRAIREQVLLLDCEEKFNLVRALHENAKEENKYYRYDFLFDNCTTRARDITRNHSKDSFVFRNILGTATPSFRDLIHSYLDKGRQPWSKLGIDILLGAKLDRAVRNEEAMFLPDYLLKGFDSALANGQPVVTPPQTILSNPPAVSRQQIFTPAFVFGLLLLFIVVAGLIRKRWSEKLLSVFDPVFFIVLGLAGILLLLMWFATDHVVCANNYNLLWALPTHLAAGFFIRTNRPWVRAYFRITAVLSVILLLAWAFLPQEMNNALLPIVLLIAVRSWNLSKKQHAG